MSRSAPTPIVSVVLATFNRLKFLRAAVRSVFDQTLTDWTLLVADDGSDLETRSFLRALTEPRVRVIELAHCGKPAVVRNAALRAATGEFVAFLDSDDLWLPEKLERQVASLRQHPQRGWSYTRFTLIDATGAPYVPARPQNWPALSGWILEPLLAAQTVIALPSVMVSRPLLMGIGGFDESLAMCEDYDLWLRLAARSEVDALDAPFTVVRRHQEHSGDDVTAWRDRLRVIERLACTPGAARLKPVLDDLRAEVAAGLAISQASCARRVAAVKTLLSAISHSWRHLRWWRGAFGVACRVGSSRALRRRIARLRARAVRARAPQGDRNPSAGTT